MVSCIASEDLESLTMVTQEEHASGYDNVMAPISDVASHGNPYHIPKVMTFPWSMSFIKSAHGLSHGHGGLWLYLLRV